jgi:hypothetical protein
MSNSHNTGAGVQTTPGLPKLPQPPLPFPAQNNSFDSLTLEQVHANFKQVWENISAWPREVGVYQGPSPDVVHPVAYFHDLTGYQLTAMNMARHKLGDTQSQQDLIVSLGLDPNGDKNSRHH